MGPPMKAATLLAGTLMAALLAMPMFAQVTPTDEKVPCRNYKDVLALFNRLGYTQKAWQAGIREIPRVYLADVPDTWRERTLSRRQEKALLPAHRPDRASHQRADPRGSGPREGADRAPRPGPERDTGRSSLADRTRGEVQGARIGERAARQRRLR